MGSIGVVVNKSIYDNSVVEGIHERMIVTKSVFNTGST